MKLGIEDLYIDCKKNIKIANELYQIAIEKDLSFDNKEYKPVCNRRTSSNKFVSTITVLSYIPVILTFIIYSLD